MSAAIINPTTADAAAAREWYKVCGDDLGALMKVAEYGHVDRDQMLYKFMTSPANGDDVIQRLCKLKDECDHDRLPSYYQMTYDIANGIRNGGTPDSKNANAAINANIRYFKDGAQKSIRICTKVKNHIESLKALCYSAKAISDNQFKFYVDACIDVEAEDKIAQSLRASY